MRYLRVQGTDLGTFLVNWYGGVVAAALLLMLISAGAATALTACSREYLVRLGAQSRHPRRDPCGLPGVSAGAANGGATAVLGGGDGGPGPPRALCIR
jgi:hypothetical protein